MTFNKCIFLPFKYDLRMEYKQKIRYIALCVLLLTIWGTQLIPAMGKVYAHNIYPVIAYCLSSFSRLIPFAIGDLFIALSIAGVLLYPIYARCFYKRRNGSGFC